METKYPQESLCGQILCKSRGPVAKHTFLLLVIMMIIMMMMVMMMYLYVSFCI